MVAGDARGRAKPARRDAFAQRDGGSVSGSEAVPALRDADVVRESALSLRACEELEIRSVGVSSVCGIGLGLRDGLKRCLRGMSQCQSKLRAQGAVLGFACRWQRTSALPETLCAQ